MSVFDFPRINFKGTIELYPGTANNDDYLPAATMPASWGGYAGEPFGLVDSKRVEARTFGMSDAAFIAWVQKAQTFNSATNPGQTMSIIPAEWNYYGDMSSSATADVIGVQTGPGQSYTAADPSVPLTSLIGAQVAFAGGITDVNSEGSPPSTQFFLDSLTLSAGDSKVSGAPSKGACQWINFYRNVTLFADGGAGGYIYHVLLKDPKKTTIDLPGFGGADVKGLILRYYLYRPLQKVQGNAALEKLYADKGMNVSTLEVAGTIAPLLDGELITTGPVGRLLIQNNATIWTPPGSQNNSSNGLISLAPAVIRQTGNLLSADFIGTFPDQFQQTSTGSINPKFDFGAVRLAVVSGGSTVDVGPVPYEDTDGGDQRGWLFDFDITSNAAAQQALQNPNATLSLVHPVYGTVLAETDYYFASNQQGIYAEQHGRGDVFLNQGTTEPATVHVYHRGKLMPREQCPPITVWQYRSIPLQAPGNAVAINNNFLPGDPIVVDTSQPGNYLFTFTINDSGNPAPGGYPPQSYLTFQNPPWVTNAPLISLRILPNDEDFSQYYVDPAAKDPVGNERLTFAVVYAKVLRTYYLLYPAMNAHIPLNSESAVKSAAGAILKRTDPAIWMTTRYMPRTRDMSATRRTLLQAWCRKVGPG